MNKYPQVLVVRSKPHFKNKEAEFLDGIASIGWPVGSSIEGLNREELERTLREEYPKITPLGVSQVHLFINLPEGSVILTPSIQSRAIHIFETLSGYNFVAENIEEGNPHTIQVRHLVTVDRGEFSDLVQRALKAARKTVTNFTKYNKEIVDLIEGKVDILDPQSEEKMLLAVEMPPEREEAIKALRELLRSEDEKIRLDAALALLQL